MTPPEEDGTDVDDAVDPTPEEQLDQAFEEELEHAAEDEAAHHGGQKRPNVFLRLYRGETAFDYIGNKRWWFGLSAVIIIAGLISLGTRGFNEGIDFKGGESWVVASQTLTVAEATTAVQTVTHQPVTVQQLTNHLNGTRQIEVTTDLSGLTGPQRQVTETAITASLAKAANTAPKNINFNEVGPSWGGEVTKRAIEALVVFFIAVVAYISFRFEFKMAIGAIVAVVHDILVTVGVYSLAGFQVTPDTVVAVLTVLGYSLYDTIVVFDRVRENAKGLGSTGRITYSEMVNLSMNQTLARSINTSLVAIVPVLSVLVVGSFVLGATSLENFGLALVIGLTSGAYSSIFIASPLLAIMKEREPRYITIRQRLESRADRGGALTPAAVAAMAGSSSSGRTRGSGGSGDASGVIRPGDGQSRKAAGSASPASGSTNRPPPRPRKPKGKRS